MPQQHPIWNKQQSETPKAYAAFCIYRNMSPAERSYQKTHDIFYGKSKANLGQIEVWGSKYNWVARAAAYDQYQVEKQASAKNTTSSICSTKN